MTFNHRGDDGGGGKPVRARATGFFRTGRINDRWWFVTPDGYAFLSLGVNHCDPGALLYPETQSVWFERYGGERERWIRDGVVRDLRAWGFNTIGWTQEVVSPTEKRHSPLWTPADYRAAQMPYCHLLPFSRTAQYDPFPVYPDVDSEEFVVWCDFVARSACVELRDDPNLIGYFYGDVPGWAGHKTAGSSWAEQGADMERTARRYYAVIAEAIRRYDTDHLLLGDRYHGPRLPSAPILQAAVESGVAVISVESFSAWSEAREILSRCHALTGRPVLLADCSYKPTDPPPGTDAHQAERGRLYAEALTEAVREPWFVGFHWCAYLTNRVRGWGLKTERDEAHTALTDIMSQVNRRAYTLAQNAAPP